jgi:lysophospholipase L1-like esterase
VLEGVNDIGGARRKPTASTADDLIAAHRQIIERAHARGLDVYGATLTPFEGAFYFTEEGEAKRSALNQWIRTTRAYDAVIDFDAVVRDPAHPARFQARYDSGDHLHPNDAGYQAMADAIDLKLFRRRRL